MATVSTVPARSNKGPSGRGGRRRRSGRRWPGRGAGGPSWRARGRSASGPEPALSFRRVVRGMGKSLIATGVLIFLFVGYQLWGTGIAEARDQKSLKNQFTEGLSPSTTVPRVAGAPAALPPAPVPGDAVALLRIPELGLEKAVVEGVGVPDLKKGPGHYSDTPMPGEKGNAAIAGHRTTYGAPFGELDKLSRGDPILVTTHAGDFRYEVDHLRVVDPSESWVLDDTEDDRLTLTTCHPKFSAAQRLIVVAKLTSPGTVSTAPALGTPPDNPPTSDAPADRPRSERADGLAGLSGDRAARSPAIAWGAVAALVWLLAWAAGRRWNRWLAYLVATPVFLVVLFLFFENFSRLLPANV